MVSKTKMTELVRTFRWKDVRDGLRDDEPLLAARDERGRNWLHVCCGAHPADRVAARDSVRTADILLELGIDIDAAAFTEDNWCATPLWYCVARGRNLLLAQHLLGRGCDPNHALWAAAFNSDLEAIRVLVRNGADIDAVVEDETPFLAAVKTSHFDSAELLLDLGADVDAADSNGMTALHYMLKKNSDVAHFVMVVAHDARGDLPDATGTTAAEIMARKKDPAFREIACAMRTGV
jgi:uncharacterized protein